MADLICPGSCNNGYRRAKAIYDTAMADHRKLVEDLADGEQAPEAPEPPRIRPWFGDPVWCGECRTIIRAALAELDDLASELAALPPGVRPASDRLHEHVKVSGSKPSPSPSPAIDELDDFGGWLRAWEAIAKRNDRRPRRGELSTERTAILAWLTDHLDPLLMRRDPIGPDATPAAQVFGIGTLRWYRVLVAGANAAKEATHVKQPCPGCGRYTLWEKSGDDYISCYYQACQRRITREDLKNAS